MLINLQKNVCSLKPYGKKNDKTPYESLDKKKKNYVELFIRLVTHGIF